MSHKKFVVVLQNANTVKIFMLTGSSDNSVFYDVNQIVIIMK